MTGLADLEKRFFDSVDTIVLLCLFTVHACSLPQDKAVKACWDTNVAKECLVSPKVKFYHTYQFSF